MEPLSIRLKHENRGEYFAIDGVEQKRDPEELIKFLREGIRTDVISAGTISNDKLYTRYIFDMKYYDAEKEKYVKNKVRIRALNKEKGQLRCLGNIEDLCNTSIKIKKVNRTRLVAGILAAVILVTTTGPIFVKGMNKIFEKEQEIEDMKYSQLMDIIDSIEPTITEEEKQAAYEEYYKDLEKRAKSGDESAKEEYEKYVFEQELKEQIIEEKSKVM